jgi:hypothetical protein
MKNGANSKVTLLKFLFILPLLCIAFSACQNKRINYSILFYDMDSYETIGNVTVNGIYNKGKYVANEDGYVNMPWEISDDNSMHVSVLFSKDGYITTDRRFMHTFRKNKSSFLIELIGLRKGKADEKCDGCLSSCMPIDHKPGNSLYQDAKDFLELHKRQALSVK